MWTEEIKVEYMDNLPGIKDMKEGTVYISKKYSVTKHLCMCGCGGLVVLPVNNIIDGKDYGWKLTEKDGKVSFTPSIGNWSLQKPYHAHYYITNSKIDWR